MIFEAPKSLGAFTLFNPTMQDLGTTTGFYDLNGEPIREGDTVLCHYFNRTEKTVIRFEREYFAGRNRLMYLTGHYGKNVVEIVRASSSRQNARNGL